MPTLRHQKCDLKKHVSVIFFLIMKKNKQVKTVCKIKYILVFMVNQYKLIFPVKFFSPSFFWPNYSIYISLPLLFPYFCNHFPRIFPMLQYLPLVEKCNMSGTALEGPNRKHSSTTRKAISSYKTPMKTGHITSVRCKIANIP